MLIHPRFHKFLAVQVGRDMFQFKVLPFGLNIAPWVFTKLTKLVVQKLVTMDVQVLVYQDAWLIQSNMKTQCVTDT